MQTIMLNLYQHFCISLATLMAYRKIFHHGFNLLAIISDFSLSPGYLLLATSLFKSFVHFEVFFFFFTVGFVIIVEMQSLSDMFCALPQLKLKPTFLFLIWRLWAVPF